MYSFRCSFKKDGYDEELGGREGWSWRDSKSRGGERRKEGSRGGGRASCGVGKVRGWREREGRWASVARKIESERGPRQKRGGGLRVNRRCTVGEGGREDGAGGGEVAADGSSDGS